MRTDRKTSLEWVLSEHSLKKLPPKDKGEKLWIRAILEVKLYTGDTVYAKAVRDNEKTYRIIKIYTDSSSRIMNVLNIHPTHLFNSTGYPVFKEDDKESRIDFLTNNIEENHIDYSSFSIEELDDEIKCFVIKEQVKATR